MFLLLVSATLFLWHPPPHVSDSAVALRYVCYDDRGTIEAVITEQGRNALLCLCPTGDTCLPSDTGDVGDSVDSGRVVPHE